MTMKKIIKSLAVILLLGLCVSQGEDTPENK